MILVEKDGHLVGGLPIEPRGTKLVIKGKGGFPSEFPLYGIVVKTDGGQHFCEFMVESGEHTIEGLHPVPRPFDMFAPGKRRLLGRNVLPMPEAA